MGQFNGARVDIDSLRDRRGAPGVLDVLAAALGATLPAAGAAPAVAEADKGTGADGRDAQEPE
jgi:hypothetical protein